MGRRGRRLQRRLARLGIFLSVCLTGVLAVGALLVGVPLALLRRGRPAARIALIVGEIVLALPMLLLLPIVVGAVGGQSVVLVVLLGNTACVVGVIVSLSRHESRAWSSCEPVVTPWR